MWRLLAAALAAPCEDAVVGAGWAGVYMAYRRASAAADPSTVCLFEASHRVGGRTYSVHVGEFVLDVGAYRFSPDMHLPGDLILHHLELPTECYEPGCPSAKDDFPKPFLFNYSQPLRRIVNPETRLPAGYATALNETLKRFTALGGRFFPETRLVDLEPEGAANGGPALRFEGRASMTIAPTQVFLNLARNHLFELPAASRLPPRAKKVFQCVSFDMPQHLFPNSSFPKGDPSALSKAYVYYEDAWWRTKLNLTEGEFPHNAFQPITSDGLRIGIHWNDGPVQCTDGKCHGFLLAYYSVSNETFYSGVSHRPVDPLGSTEDAAKLEVVHKAIVDAIAPTILKEAGIAPSSLPKPSKLVVGAWDRPDNQHPYGSGYTAPTKVYWAPEISGSLANACGVEGLTAAEYAATVHAPWPSVHLANNDWVQQDVNYMYGDWAEESLLQAERILRSLGMAKPAWLDADYYAKFVESKAVTMVV